MRKRWLTPILPMVLLGTLLAGCGVTTTNTGTLSPQCPTAAPQANATTIDWWVPWSNPVLTRAAQDFNCEHPEIRIKTTLYPGVGDDRQGKLLAATVGKSPPNVVVSFSDVLAKWAAQGMLQPLDDAIDQAGLREEEFVPEAWNFARWQGSMYGVPIDWDPDTLLWYNKKVFADAGLDPERPPETFAELEEYARKIDRVKNGKIERLGFIPWSGWEFNEIAFGHLFGAGLESGSDQKVALNTPGMRRVLEWMQGISKRYGGAAKVDSFANLGNATGAAADPLFSGRLGMQMVGDWYLGNRAVVGKEAFEETIGVGIVPPGPGGEQYLCHSGWSFMMPKGADNVEETMTFITWMLEPERFAKYFGAALGWIPAHLESRKVDFYAKDKMWQAILAANAKAGPEREWLPPSPVLSEFYRASGDAEQQVTNLLAEPEEALGEADDIVQQALQVAITEGNYGTPRP